MLAAPIFGSFQQQAPTLALWIATRINNMGLLILGAPLAWEDSKKYIDHVKQHGVEQFINLYNRYEGKTGSILRWGDEREYFVCSFDHEKKQTRLPLRSPGTKP